MTAKIGIRYTTSPGWNGEQIRVQPLNGWRFNGGKDTGWISVSGLPDNLNGEIKCAECHANNWTDNGETMNQYECDCCGAFVTTEPKQ